MLQGLGEFRFGLWQGNYSRGERRWLRSGCTHAVVTISAKCSCSLAIHNTCAWHVWRYMLRILSDCSKTYADVHDSRRTVDSDFSKHLLAHGLRFLQGVQVHDCGSG